MSKEETLLSRLRFTQGERDAARGTKPKHEHKDYLRGYARQYEREQRVTARTEIF